ncbi:hypothetical protein BK789_03755 [Bacillus thuringiensis serovar darmstadiensis]|nr:hypothetical protein BK789_03755 [Bacillus thuringiensis serovar darmstadiensis]
MYCFFLKFYIISYSNFAHRKIPSIVNRLMCFLFTVYYKGIISYKSVFSNSFLAEARSSNDD